MKKRLSVIVSLLLSICLTASAAVTELNPNPPRPHPFDNSMSENSLNPPENFGVEFPDIEGDFRATFGEGGRDEKRYAILAFTGLSTVGARTGSVKPTSFILQPIKNANGEPIEDLQDKTGYMVYYVGRDGVPDMLIPNLTTMFEKYAVFFNGNAEYLKERILPKVEATPVFNQMPTNDYPELGSPGFGTKDMFIKAEGKLFFNIAFLQNLSGAGNSVVIDDTLPERQEQRDEWGTLLARESDPSYYSQQMKSWQVSTAYWPQIQNFTVQENGDVTYIAEIYGANGNSGKVDLIANFADNKSKLPSAELDSLNEYWRKMMFAYYQNLIAGQSSSNPFRNYVKELDAIPYTNQPVQTVTKTIPAAEVQSIIDSSRPDNNITLYVTDMFGRYIYQTIDYNISARNLKATDIWYSPDPVNPNDQVAVSALITNESSESVETEVVARKGGVELGRKTMTLAAGQAARTAGFSFIAPNVASVNVEFEVNPDKDKPNNESNWIDNRTSRPIPIVRPNLKVEENDIWYSPDPVEPNDAARVSVLVQNESNQSITTDVRAKKDGQVITTKTVTVPAYGSVRTPAFTFTAPNKSSVNVEFEVNLGKNKPASESNWADNKADKDIPIAQAKNIAVTISKTPEVIASLKRFNYKVNVTNTGNTTESFTLSTHQPYKDSEEHCDDDDCWWHVHNYPNEMDRSFSVTLKPKESKSFDVEGFSGWDYFDFDYSEYSITMTANVTHLPGEVRYSDNTASKTIPVKPMRIKVKLKLEK